MESSRSTCNHNHVGASLAARLEEEVRPAACSLFCTVVSMPRKEHAMNINSRSRSRHFGLTLLALAAGCSANAADSTEDSMPRAAALLAPETFDQPVVDLILTNVDVAGYALNDLTLNDKMITISSSGGSPSGDSAFRLYRQGSGDWRPQAAGDVDGDGINDLFWRNRTTGETVVEYMGMLRNFQYYYYGGDETRSPVSGGALSPSTRLPDIVRNVGPEWQIVSVVDFNGDGQKDLVWFNTATGQAALWYMRFSAQQIDLIEGQLFSNPNPGGSLVWRLRGAGNIYGDATPDLVWQNVTTGQIAIWDQTGLPKSNANPNANGALTGYVITGSEGLGPDWTVATVTDVTHNGVADLVFQNQRSHEAAVWELDGKAIKNPSYFRSNFDGKNWTTTLTIVGAYNTARP